MSLSEGNLRKKMKEENPCLGRGRYLVEHWVHSHPSVQPCDLYPGPEYIWNYDNIPGRDWTIDLQAAPRFEFDTYLIPGACDGPESKRLQISKFIEQRSENYEVLYGSSDLESDWWGWDFLERSGMTPWSI
jgi:hypothetical protein